MTGNEQTVDVSRMAKQVTLFDPNNAVSLDSSSPTNGALFLDRMIKIIVSVRGTLRWYDVDVLTGPITHVDRDGPIITLEAQGIESFGMSEAFATGTVKGYKVAAFADLMARTGEVAAWMDLPTNDERLTKDIAIARDTKLWLEAFKVAQSLGRYCYYDGSGHLRTREWSSAPAIEFVGGSDGLLLSEPQLSYSTEDFKNAWWVKTSSSSGKDVEATAVLPSTHPLAPLKLGRNSKPKYLLGIEDDGDLRTSPACLARANFLLKESGLSTSVQFEARPVYHLDPFDWAMVTTDDFAMPFPIVEFSMPIVAGRPMTVGYTTNLTSPNVTRIRGL